MTTVVKCTPRKPNWTLYIGRNWAGIPASKWHNPFHANIGLARCLELYEQHVRSHPELMAALHEIDDQVLGCWCHRMPTTWSPGELLRCHGDVLIKLRKEQLGEGIH